MSRNSDVMRITLSTMLSFCSQWRKSVQPQWADQQCSPTTVSRPPPILVPQCCGVQQPDRRRLANEVLQPRIPKPKTREKISNSVRVAQCSYSSAKRHLHCLT